MKPKRGITRCSERKRVRRETAEKRKKRWEQLSPSEKLLSLDGRLGKDHGAKKQRKKLADLIQEKGTKDEGK